MLHRVASTDDLPPGSGREVIVADRVVALFRVGDEFYALDGLCPHAGGPLGEGCLTGTRVTCPWHGWQFDVTTGQHCLAPNIVHTTFPVIVEDGSVFVELD